MHTHNNDLVKYYEMQKFKKLFHPFLKLMNSKSCQLDNKIFKLKGMSSNGKLTLCSGVMPRLFILIMKVGIHRKLIPYVTVIVL